MGKSTIRPLIVPFIVGTCVHSGDPGCLGSYEGVHDGPCEYGPATYHRCAECGGDDVYGSGGVYHEDGCSAAADSATPRPGDAPRSEVGRG